MTPTDKRDERIRKLLSSLPHAQTPPGFEEQLLRRIARERARTAGLPPAWIRSYTVPALSLIIVGVLSYVMYMTQFRSAGDNVRQESDTVSGPGAGSAPVPAGGSEPAGVGIPGKGSPPGPTPGPQSSTEAVPRIEPHSGSAPAERSVPEPGAAALRQRQVPTGTAPEEKFQAGRDAGYIPAPGGAAGRTAAREFRGPLSGGLLAAPKGFFTPGMPGLMKAGRSVPGRLLPEEAVSDSAARADSTSRRDSTIPEGKNAQPDSLRTPAGDPAPTDRDLRD